MINPKLRLRSSFQTISKKKSPQLHQRCGQNIRGKYIFLYGHDQKKLISWTQKVKKALFRRDILVYTLLFESHKKEAYFMDERVNVIFLLVGGRVGINLDSFWCISFSGVDDAARSADKILDLSNE